MREGTRLIKVLSRSPVDPPQDRRYLEFRGTQGTSGSSTQRKDRSFDVVSRNSHPLYIKGKSVDRDQKLYHPQNQFLK